MAEGKDTNYEFFWQPFFYPAFLSIVYLASNSSIICARVIQILLGCITCLLTYQLGRIIFNRRTGIIAGIMTAFYGPLIFFEAELLASGLAALWSVVLILLFVKTSSKKSVWLCASLGICGALSVLTRPTFVPFLAVSAIWLFVKFHQTMKKRSQSILRLGVILASFLLIAIPVALQNLRVTNHFGILPAAGGINFYIGNNPNYAETLTARPGWGWEEITRIPEQNGIKGNMWEQQKYFNKQIINFVSTEPLTFLNGLFHKTIQFINSRELPRNVDIYLFTKWSRLLGLLVWKVGGFGFPFGALLPLMLLGLVSHWRRLPVPIKLFLILYPLSIIVVFVAARYRVPIIPVMTIVAAAGLITLVKTIRSCRWRPIVIVGICGTALVLLSGLPGPFPEELPNYEAELYANAAATYITQDKNNLAIEYLNKALTLKKDYPSAYANLGAAMAKKGEFDKAISHYKTALDYKNDFPEVHNNLASALADMGKTDQAFKHYQKAIQIRPNHAEAYYNLGSLFLKTGKIEEAVKYLNKAVQIREDYFMAHTTLGAALAKQGNAEKAIAHFFYAVKLKPNDDKVRYNLAKALADSGRIEEAAKEYREALRLNPNNPETLTQLAGILTSHENTQIADANEAIRLAKKACELTSYQHPEKIDTLAKAYEAAAKFNEAAATLEKRLKLNKSLVEWNKYFEKQIRYYKTRAAKQQNQPRSELNP
jgi:tetratricopeptide (TPR) repeat protein